MSVLDLPRKRRATQRQSGDYVIQNSPPQSRSHTFGPPLASPETTEAWLCVPTPTLVVKKARVTSTKLKSLREWFAEYIKILQRTEYAWLGELYSLSTNGKTRQAINLLFDRFDDALSDGQFALCNSTLQVIDLRRLDPTILTAILAITLRAREKLPFRERLVPEIERVLKQVVPNEVDELMDGLR